MTTNKLTIEEAERIAVTRCDDARIRRALDAGWTDIVIATGKSTHPMCAGIRSLESGPRAADEILVGCPPNGKRWGTIHSGGHETKELPL